MLEHLRGSDDVPRLTERLWHGSVYYADSLPIPNHVYLVNGQVTAMPAIIPLAHESMGKDSERNKSRLSP